MKIKSHIPMLICTGLFVVLIIATLLIRHYDSTGYLASSQNSDQKSQSDTADSIKVNINTATADELMLLPGIGEALAKRIVDYREDNGAFRRIEQLLEVKGIGKAKLAEFKDYITVGGQP